MAPRRPMRSRQVAYALVRRGKGRSGNMEVLLQQRPSDAAQMPGMWELPEVEEGLVEKMEPVLRARHAITNTNHYVCVYAFDLPPEEGLQGHRMQQWANAATLLEVPLTGLARKVLMRMDILPRPKSIRTDRGIPATYDPLLI